LATDAPTTLTPTPTPTVLQADKLYFGYPQRPLFTNLSVLAPPGLTWVRGGDGCGKSTLLRLLAGDLAAHAGELRIHGVRLSEDGAAYRAQVFWMDPRTAALDQISAQNYFASLQPRYPQWDALALVDAVQGLSLAQHIDKPMYMLSTGSKRKVWLAAACASGAPLTLLDDPFAALDKPSIVYVLQLLRRAAQHAERAWVVAHYELPADSQGSLPLAARVDLGD
jgi:ABC-type transport system involved in cytochrome c biogenesis ATPase subunit